MNNLDRIKSLRAQDYGVAGLSTTDVDWLIAEVERLQIAADFERESAKDANAQLNAMRAECERYKAWHDKVVAQPVETRWLGNVVGELRTIVRPQSLKENE